MTIIRYTNTVFTEYTNKFGPLVLISQKIVEAHGGRILAENNPDGKALHSHLVFLQCD